MLRVNDPKGNLKENKESKTSETKVAMPIKIGVYALDVNPYLHKFFESIPID